MNEQAIPPIIQIKGLSHRYSVQWAINDIDLEINQKGIYGLLGSNGAGKSTLMNILCGVIKQTKGSVKINGIDTTIQPIETKRFIGFLPQKPPLHNDLTVEEYLRYCAYLRWIPKNEIEAAITEVLEKCNISHFRRRLIRNLSGGYQQRVGIAQAIIHKPVMVVLDEPTNGLDPNQILEIRSLIEEIAQERTVILSTHMLSEVQAICQHIYMIEQGQMIFSGSVQEFDNYVQPSTLQIRLMNPPEDTVLNELPGVVKVESLGDFRYRLHYTDPRELTDRLVKSSVEQEWQLTEIHVEKNSMDTIFAELSKSAQQKR